MLSQLCMTKRKICSIVARKCKATVIALFAVLALSNVFRKK